MIFVAAALLAALSPSSAPGAPIWNILSTYLGAVLLCLGVAIRSWAGLYIGGRKNRELITDGPYRVVRNPLYVGNFVMAGGLVMLASSLVMAAFLPLLVVVCVMTVRREEGRLRGLFGDAYEAYRDSAPAFIPKAAGVRQILADPEPRVISHRNLARELRRGGIAFVLGLVVVGLIRFRDFYF